MKGQGMVDWKAERRVGKKEDLMVSKKVGAMVGS